MEIKNRIAAAGLEKAYRYLEKDPVQNLPKLMELVDRFAGDAFAPQRDVVRRVVNDPENNWNRLLCSLWTDIDSEVLKKIFTNFLLNANFIGWEKQEKAREKYNCNIPWAILMDPTSACNLHCTGCWAAEYGNKLNLSLEELDGIIRQGKELGVYFYIYSGGEPLVRKDDILRLCRMHDDCVFLAFTNATLIDEAFAKEMLDVRNFVPAISVEGFAQETDARRGQGTFDRVMEAMRILRENRLPFGVSCCYTRANAETIGSEAYFDKMIEWGAKFAWFFTYMPVGSDAVPDLMVTAEQRKAMYRSVRAFRNTKPLFTMDFWNDGEFTHGCIAALPAHQRQRRRGSLRVHPLLRLQHPGEDPAGGPAGPAVPGVSPGPALQREPPAPLPRAGQPREAHRHGGLLRRALDGPDEPGERGGLLRQVRGGRRQLGPGRRCAPGGEARRRAALTRRAEKGYTGRQREG